MRFLHAQLLHPVVVQQHPLLCNRPPLFKHTRCLVPEIEAYSVSDTHFIGSRGQNQMLERYSSPPHLTPTIQLPGQSVPAFVHLNHTPSKPFILCFTLFHSSHPNPLPCPDYVASGQFQPIHRQLHAFRLISLFRPKAQIILGLGVIWRQLDVHRGNSLLRPQVIHHIAVDRIQPRGVPRLSRRVLGGDGVKKVFCGLLEGEKRRCMQRGCEGFAGEGVEYRPAVGVQGNGEGGSRAEGMKKADEGLALRLGKGKGAL